MAKIKLLLHRRVQRNVGSGMKPDYVHSERPSIIHCSVPRLYERDPSQLVHLLPGNEPWVGHCDACDTYFNDLFVWTDDVQLWERHPQRCNWAYVP